MNNFTKNSTNLPLFSLYSKVWFGPSPDFKLSSIDQHWMEMTIQSGFNQCQQHQIGESHERRGALSCVDNKPVVDIISTTGAINPDNQGRGKSERFTPSFLPWNLCLMDCCWSCPQWTLYSAFCELQCEVCTWQCCGARVLDKKSLVVHFPLYILP